MIYNNIAQLQELYFHNSRYSVDKPANSSYDSLLQWPRNGYFERLIPNAALLREALTSYPSRETSTVAEQIFGNQLHQQKISLKHLASVLNERSTLNYRHLKDIDRRMMQCHERLSIIKMHSPIDGGRSQQNLEKLIIELEKQRHDEETGFWKDTIDIKQKLLETASAYSAARQRKDIFYGLEEQQNV